MFQSLHRQLLSLLLILNCLTSAYANTEEFRFERQWPQQDSAWTLDQPAEVAVDYANNLYVVDSYNHRVQQYTAAGNFIRSFGSEGVGPGQLLFPADVAIAIDGNVYILDNGNNRVQVFNNTGTWLTSIGRPGGNNGELKLTKPEFSQEGRAEKPGALAIDDFEQLLYVADAGNNRISVFDLQGNFKYHLAQNQIKQPGGLAVDPYDGTLYVVDTGNQRLLHIALNRVITPLNWRFNHPTGVAVDETTGAIYVSERAAAGYSEIVNFDEQGFYQRTLASNGQLIGATGLAVNYSGDLYIADTGHLIVQWLSTLDGSFKWYFGNSAPFSWLYEVLDQYLGTTTFSSLFNGYFYLPLGIATTKDGNVYVVDHGNHRIQVFDKDGKYLSKFGAAGTTLGTFLGPSCIAISPNDILYVCDSYNHRIQIFNRDGIVIASFGSLGTGLNQLNTPTDLAIGTTGLIYVADTDNNRIQVFAPNGVAQGIIGSPGQGNGQFSSPGGITVAPDGSFFVADSRNHRIQKFNAAGSFIKSFGRAGKGNGEFNEPTRMILNKQGNLYITDSNNNRIQEFTTNGDFVQVLGSGGVTEGQFRSPTAIAQGSDNALYISDSLNNRIQKYKRNTFVPTQTSIKHQFKAIILAGGGVNKNPLWDSTQILANRAFATLRAQGFQKDEIAYLTSGNTQMDLDSNGNDTDDLKPATLANLETAFTNWASDSQEVLLYLIDHGGPGTFKVNGNEILTREQLSQWLQQLESKLPAQGKVTIIIEACKSAGFFNGLPSLPAGKKRTLIASANSEQPAMMSNKGLISFSYYFWSELRAGAPMQEAFKTARQGMSAHDVPVEEKSQRQAAQLDANNDGIFNESDYSALGNACLGNCIVLAADVPEIQGKTAATTLHGETKLTLDAQVQSLEPITRLWFTVIRPDSFHSDSNEPIYELPLYDLDCNRQNNGSYQCKGHYDQFDTKGTYTLTFYAQDKSNRTSLPVSSSITQTIGKEAPSRPQASETTRYLPASGELIIEDVTVAGQHFWAKLQDQGGQQFKLLDYRITSTRLTPSAQFNSNTGVLVLPKVSAGTQHYHVTLQMQNNLFSVKEARLL